MSTLTKIDRTLKTIGVVLGGLAGLAASGAGSDASGAGALIPAWLGVAFGFAAMVATYLSGAPLFDAGKGPVVTRVLQTIAGLSALVLGSTLFPQVQALFSTPHAAHRIAAAVALLGALATLFLKSPLIEPVPPAAGN